jgi:iron(III) transport system ATP-binding protein
VSTETQKRRRLVADGSAAETVLRCSKVCVAYDGRPVLHGIDLDVQAGQLVALLGASGSGKSTLLHAIAGLLEVSTGEIWLGGRCVADGRSHTPPEQRDVGMVFQNFALWPHLRVIDTVAYPMRRAGRQRQVAHLAARELLAKLDIAHLAETRPAELSGGEQQRVGLARALARAAQLYLLDEPTAHLDTHLRVAFQQAVLARRRETNAAIIYSTHDATEALALADQVALIENGRLVQLAPPTVVYAQPVSASAASLTGPCSVLNAKVAVIDQGVLSVDFGSGALAVPGNRGGALDPGRYPVMLRPDWVGEGGPLPGSVTGVAFRGTHTDYQLETLGQSLQLSLPGHPRYTMGSPLSWGPHRVWVLDQPTANPPLA